MKKLCLTIVVSLFTASYAAASNPFDNFTSNLTGSAADIAQNSLDNFTKDLGILINGNSFHSGKTLGFPGLDLSIRAASRNISSDNTIVKSAGVSGVALPVIQAEIGLPARFDVMFRYMSYYDSSLMGFGARYGIIDNNTPLLPSLSVQVLYSTLDVKDGGNKFKATSTSVMAMGSLNVPVVDPYIGIGMDATTVEPDSSIPVPRSGMKGTASNFRLEGGINIGLLPLAYLQIGGALTSGGLDYTAGLGIKF